MIVVLLRLLSRRKRLELKFCSSGAWKFRRRYPKPFLVLQERLEVYHKLFFKSLTFWFFEVVASFVRIWMNRFYIVVSTLRVFIELPLNRLSIPCLVVLLFMRAVTIVSLKDGLIWPNTTGRCTKGDAFWTIWMDNISWVTKRSFLFVLFSVSWTNFGHT